MDEPIEAPQVDRASPGLGEEDTFRSLFEHMGEGVALHDVVRGEDGTVVNYRILEVNPQYEQYTGLKPEQVVGRLATEAYGTPRAPYLDEFTAVGVSGVPARMKTYFPPLDRHYEISIAPMGKDRFATIFLDVSERIHQEKALRAKTEELDRFFQLTPDLLCIAGLDGRFLRLNAAWEKTLGWPVSRLEGLRFLDLVHPEDITPTLEAIRSLAAGREIIDFTNRYRCSDGSYRWIEWRGTPTEEGLIFSAARDVTERILQERALHDSEEKFRRIYDLIPHPVTLTDMDGILISCNTAFCEVMEFRRDEVIGHTSVEMGLWQDVEARTRLREAILRDGRLDGFEATIRTRSGKLLQMQFSARFLDLEGRKTMLMLARDTTEQRNLERQMLHSQKLESLGVLAGGIAHDFNNLLTGILGNADLARLEMSPLAPARTTLDGIEKAARRAADLCRQLLAYSGKGRFVVQPVDIAVLVEEMGHLLSVSISKKAVLKYHFARGLPAVDADATQMRQVVMNLIVNASEAIGDRSGVIALTTGLAQCDAGYLDTCFTAKGIQPGDYVFLEVADTGRGMDKATLDRIFDPFFSTKFTGRGLGLAAVLGIVRGHHGAIRVHSEPGRGTTFRLLFPAADAPVPAGGAPVPGRENWVGKGTLLLVDDEETIRNLGRRILERAGFQVLLAGDGNEALTVFGQVGSTVDLVILDLTMPHLDGKDAFRELRRLDSGLKVLLSSGYNEQEALNQFPGKGLAGFIQKPYTAEELVDKVREALEG